MSSSMVIVFHLSLSHGVELQSVQTDSILSEQDSKGLFQSLSLWWSAVQNGHTWCPCRWQDKCPVALIKCESIKGVTDIMTTVVERCWGISTEAESLWTAPSRCSCTVFRCPQGLGDTRWLGLWQRTKCTFWLMFWLWNFKNGEDLVRGEGMKGAWD